MRRMTVFLVPLLLAPPAGLAAQETPPLLVGMRVRVTTSEPHRISLSPITNMEIRRTGAIIALKADTLVLREKENSAPRAISLAQVKRLDLSQGRESQGKSALKGGGIGFLAGVVLGGLAGTSVAGQETSEGAGGVAIVGALAGGTLGTLFGAGMGALAGGERWEQVPLPLRLGISPQRGGGVRLAASFRF